MTTQNTAPSHQITGRFLKGTAAAGALLAAWSMPSFAQDQQVAQEVGKVEEITVTARRREENLQDIPLAVSVLSADALDSTGSYNVNRLTQLQPSLQFFSTNPRNTTVNIRGLGAPFGLTNDGIDQGVGLYVDQVYNSRIAAAALDFLDVSQVEVLRGPQGTLYGKNTTAGAINVTTRKPSFEPEAQAEISYGNLDFVQAKGSVSGPIIADKLAARFAVTSTDRKGTIYNRTTDKWVNAQDNFGVRGSFLFRANDDLKVTLSGDLTKQDAECCAQIYVRTGSTQRPLNRQFAGLAAAFNYAPPSTNAFDRVTDLDTPLDAYQRVGGTSLLAEWEIGPGTLTSASAWRFWDWRPSNDRDFTGLPITPKSNNPLIQNQYSQEFRYAVTGERFDYVAGLFAYQQKQHTTGIQTQGAAASRWLLNPTSANANNPAILNGLTSQNDIMFKTTSLAAFGQLGWKATDKLKVQPGLRVNFDRKSGSYTAVVSNGTNTPLIADQLAQLAPQSYEPKFKDWNVSGDLNISYQFATDILGYATYAKTFKSGGINLNGLPLDAANRPILSVATVKPENVNHFELGLKTQLADNRVTANFSAYWTDIKDYQATVTNGQLGVIRGYLANAEKVRVRGLEADFSYRPTESLSLYVNGAYTDHKYVRFVDAPCPPELSGGTTVAAGQTPSAPGTPGGLSPAFCDISGQWLPGISKLAASYGAEYHTPTQVLGRDGEAYIGFDGNYRSKFSSNASRSAYTDIDGYAITNFRVGFRTDAGWDLSGWVRNAFDTNYYEVLALQSGSTGLVVGQPADPRTYGVTLKAKF